MVKKGDKKKKDKLDQLIVAAEAVLAATSKMPAEVKGAIEQINKNLIEIHSMFTAIKGFTEQELKRMQNLETAFTTVVADLQELKAVLGAKPTPVAAPQESNNKGALVFTSIDALPLRDDIKKKLRFSVENDVRTIRCDWLGDNWKSVNKLLRQFGFKWQKDEVDKKNSRWIEA